MRTASSSSSSSGAATARFARNSAKQENEEAMGPSRWLRAKHPDRLFLRRFRHSFSASQQSGGPLTPTFIVLGRALASALRAGPADAFGRRLSLSTSRRPSVLCRRDAGTKHCLPSQKPTAPAPRATAAVNTIAATGPSRLFVRAIVVAGTDRARWWLVRRRPRPYSFACLCFVGCCFVWIHAAFSRLRDRGVGRPRLLLFNGRKIHASMLGLFV